MFWRKKNVVPASNNVAGQEIKNKNIPGQEGELESGAPV